MIKTDKATHISKPIQVFRNKPLKNKRDYISLETKKKTQNKYDQLLVLSKAFTLKSRTF